MTSTPKLPEQSQPTVSNTAKVVFLGGPCHREFHRLPLPFPEQWLTSRVENNVVVKHVYTRAIFHIRPTEFRIVFHDGSIHEDDAKWALRDIYADVTPGGL